MLVRERPKLYRSRINREEIAPETYRKLFRFDKENVEWLAHRFIPEHDEKRVCVFGCALVCACIGVFFSFCSEICHPGMLYCHVRKGYPTRMTFEYTTSMRNPPLFSHE